MPLRVVEITDLRDFTRSFVSIQGPKNVDPHNDDFSNGNNLGTGDGTSIGSEFMHGAYFHNADLYFYRQELEKDDPITSNRVLYPFFYAHDALCRNPNRGWYYPVEFQPTFGSANGISYHFGDSNVRRRVIVGQPNLQTGQQSFFRYGSISGSPNSAPETYVIGWHRFDCQTGARQNVFENFWPQISFDLAGPNGGAANGSTAGFWIGASSNQEEYHAIVFEGITSTVGGMPGETSPSAGMLRAVTSHPKGLMLVRADASNFLGNGGANNLGQRWIWVDITTGLAVGVLGVSGPVNSFSANTFHDESIDHKTFNWQRVQFVPDEGSSFNRPKGELHFTLSEDTRFQLPNQLIQPGVGTSFTSTVLRSFVKVVDFNPFNELTGTVRIHNRTRFLGILDIPMGPIIAGGNTVGPTGSIADRRNPGIYYHPPSRTWINVQSSFTSASNNGANQPTVGFSRIVRFARQVLVGNLSSPVPDTPVRQQSLLTFRTEVFDDFGDLLAGATINFRSKRQSTRSETFNGTTQGATNYVVARGTIDNDASLQVYSGGTVDTGGTLLLLGVHYNVVSYATGTLSPVGTWPAATISVRYRHRSVPVYPGFGSLVETSAVSDANGVATVVLELEDDLQGELLGLEANSEAFV